jgi:aspartate dehydrogenase
MTGNLSVSDVSGRGAPLGVGLIGCGVIGSVLAHAIDEVEAGNTRLIMMYDLVIQKSKKLVNVLSIKPKIAKDFTELVGCEDVHLVIEAASQDAVRQYASKVLRAGKDLMIMSVGALVEGKLTNDIRNLADSAGRKVYIPSGAIAGLDGLKSAAIDRIDEVILTTRKPAEGLKGISYIEQSGIDIDALSKPKTVYKGSAVEACKLFPANVNVAAALSLAGIGPQKTKVRIVADPTIQMNIHEIRVKGKFGEFTVHTENMPSPNSPKTSYLAALSAVATLKRITENLLIGT